MQSNSDITPLIIDAISDKKGKKTVVVDLSSLDSASASKLIICQGNSSVREKLNLECGVKPFNYEGYKNCQWIVIDYGYIMVHVFLPEVREFYSLESLWEDAPIEYIEDTD